MEKRYSVTEQKPGEAISDAERLLSNLADVSLDAIYVKDRNSRWLFANPALERIAGKPVSELLGKTDAEIYSNPEIGKLILENDRKIMESGKAETFEEFVDLTDGRHFFISVKSPRFNEKGEVIGLIGISHDITPRKRREEQLKASQKKYKDLIETTNDFVWEVDREGRYTYCSPQMERLWKLKPEEMIGKTPFDQMPAEAKEEGLRFYRSTIASKKPFSAVQVPSLDGQGNLIFIEISGVPFFDDKRELLGYRGITRDITGRKKAEDSLKESEERFRVLTQTSPIGVGVSSADGVLLYTNPAYESILGYNRNELVGKKSNDLYLNPADRISWLKTMKEGHDIRNVPIRLKKKDGTPVWVSINTSDICYEGKQAIMGTIQDITERRQMQEKLEEYARNLEGLVEERTKKLETSALYARGLIEASLDPLVTINAEGKITDVNKATETTTGCSREELVGSDFSDYFTQPDEARRGYLQVFQNGFVRDYPLSIRNKSGKIIEVLYNATLLKNEAGEVEGVFAAARDMTEHKKAEEALLNERKRLFDVLETLPAMVCLLTPDHHVDFANRSFRDRFGDSEGRYCYDYCFGNKEPCSFCESYKPLETGKPHHWEVNAPDGSIIDAYDFPFTDVDGSKKILEMDVDITKRRKMEKQLKDSERLAAIGATAGMVGHDIRNPLQAIGNDVYLLRSDVSSLPNGRLKEDLAESLDSIEQNVQYINKIVQDLQDFAKPIKPVAKEIDVEALIKDVLFKSGVPENIDVSCQVDKEAKKFVTDPEVLKRVLSNLVSNAVQAMPKGGKLAVYAIRKENDVTVTVEDSGVGIPEEMRSKLFTPLFTTKSKGQGFGLAVIKRMTEALGGAVDFESEVGKGTTFILRFPSQN